MTKCRGVIYAFILIILANAVHAATAMQTVESQVNRLIAVLGDQSLTGAEGEEKKKEVIRQISDRLFDFSVMSRFTLGRNWKKLNLTQQKEFIVLYRKLLEKVYMGRLLEYRDEKVMFDEEKKLSDTRVEVKTYVIADSGQIPIVYRMVTSDGAWKVYDLIIENISLVKNYRSQFNTILNKNSPAEMLDLLKEKTTTNS